MAAAVQVPEREVLTCRHCKLVQYKRASGQCPRCLSPYVPTPAPNPAQTESPVPSDLPGGGLSRPGLSVDLQTAFAAHLRNLRDESDLSQREMARKMGVPRTYISKIETSKAFPILRQFPKLAAALGVDTIDILPPEFSKPQDVFEIKLARLVGKLNETQRIEVLEYVQLLASRKTATAECSERRLSA